MFTQAKSTETPKDILIKWLKNQRFIEQAESLRNGATSLDLGDGGVGDEGANVITRFLKNDNSLIKLSLNKNNITHNGAIGLAAALEVNTSLADLNLGNNSIGKGITALANALTNNTSLTQLDLALNQIGEGARAIADALKTNTSLTQLNFNLNQIGEAGGRAIADALKTNTSLTQLNFNLNQIGEAGGRAIADALKTNTSITELNLYNNQIGNVEAEIKEYIQRNIDIRGTLLDIEQQTKSEDNTIVKIVNEIVYDNPLLNHSELLKTALSKFSLQDIVKLSDKLNPDLVNTAINSEEGELIILGGLMSLENDNLL